MKRRYEDHEFGAASLKIIAMADTIMNEYAGAGYDLTLRQLYYQFVARGLLDNKERNYKRLGDIISLGRLAGFLHWDIMVDRTREVRSVSHWDGPGAIVKTCADAFRLDTRADQDTYIEVWVEKEALAGIVEPVCQELDVDCLVCRGFLSQSAMWQGAWRFSSHRRQRGVLLHLGDHDPSGIDMTRDIKDRLNDTFGQSVAVVRIALTMEQVQELQPPPNPAKTTDSRYAGYVTEYGKESWEMDAIEPQRLEKIIRDHVEYYTDADRRQELMDQQDRYRAQLAVIAKRLLANPDWTPGRGKANG